VVGTGTQPDKKYPRCVRRLEREGKRGMSREDLGRETVIWRGTMMERETLVRRKMEGNRDNKGVREREREVERRAEWGCTSSTTQVFNPN